MIMLLSLLTGCLGEDPDVYVPHGGAMLDASEEPEDLSLQEEELQSLNLTYFPDRSMNPLIGNNITNRVLFSLIYQGLFSIDRDNVAVPILCSYYEVTTDVHISALGVDRNTNLKKKFSIGQEMSVVIKEIDSENHRISLVPSTSTEQDEEASEYFSTHNDSDGESYNPFAALLKK